MPVIIGLVTATAREMDAGVGGVVIEPVWISRCGTPWCQSRAGDRMPTSLVELTHRRQPGAGHPAK
jgi:hypothetical protein